MKDDVRKAMWATLKNGNFIKHGNIPKTPPKVIYNKGAETWWDSMIVDKKLSTAPLSVDQYNSLNFEQKRDVNHAFVREVVKPQMERIM